MAVEDAHVGAIASYYSATATLSAEKDAEILARATRAGYTLTEVPVSKESEKKIKEIIAKVPDGDGFDPEDFEDEPTAQ
mgnify:CR=1 FL=1